MFVLTGLQGGPLCRRGLHQNADSHTFVPGGSSRLNRTAVRVCVVLPMNCHCERSLGGRG